MAESLKNQQYPAIKEILQAKQDFLDFRGHARHYLSDAYGEFNNKRLELTKRCDLKENNQIVGEFSKIEKEVLSRMDEIKSQSDQIIGANQPDAPHGKLYYEYGNAEIKSVQESLIRLRHIVQGGERTVNSNSLSKQKLQTFLQNKDDDYYAKNVRPLFPIGSESKSNAIYKEDFAKLLQDKDMMNNIIKSGNSQMINRIYTLAVEQGMHQFGNQVTQEAFKNFEKAVVNIKGNKVHLEKSDVVKQRLDDLSKQKDK